MIKTTVLFLIALAGCLAALLCLKRLDAWLERKFINLARAWVPLSAGAHTPAFRRSPVHRAFLLALCAAFSTLVFPGVYGAAADAVAVRCPGHNVLRLPANLSVCLPSAATSASACPSPAGAGEGVRRTDEGAWASRLAALAMLESGNRDAAIGRAGEVSRYQITPRVWRQYAHLDPIASGCNPFTACNVASAIMQDRCRAFENRFHRSCTETEFYILWARPAVLFQPSAFSLQPCLKARAVRFANLVSINSQPSTLNH